ATELIVAHQWVPSSRGLNRSSHFVYLTTLSCVTLVPAVPKSSIETGARTTALTHLLRRRAVSSNRFPVTASHFPQEIPRREPLDVPPNLDRAQRMEEIMNGQVARPELAVVALAGHKSIALLGKRLGGAAKLRVLGR